MKAHEWIDASTRMRRKRQCRRCGVVQSYSSGRRSHTYRVHDSWYPPAGRCGEVDLQLRRVGPGEYVTRDGLFSIWQLPNRGDYERRWYVNWTDTEVMDETLSTNGFHAKWVAVEWLRENAAKWARKLTKQPTEATKS